MPVPSQNKTPVWSIAIRFFHWALVISIITAWVTHHGPGWLHDAAGYSVLVLIGFRLARSLFGKPAERFSRFVCGWKATTNYVRRLLAGTEQRYLGHNPLGGWMIVALILTATLTSLSGWLYVTDRFWGVEWVEELHDGSANLLLALIGIHVLGVIFTSFRQGENLAASMIHGEKARTTKKHPDAPREP